MPMRDQPEGVRRRARGTDRPPREYDVYVDDQLAGYMERLPHFEWRAYRDGEWPRKFPIPGAFLAGATWIRDLHRAAKATTEPVTATEQAQVREELPAAVASPFGAGSANPLDPFWGDPFADPLA